MSAGHAGAWMPSSISVMKTDLVARPARGDFCE
jgi:hypothetical protein